MRKLWLLALLSLSFCGQVWRESPSKIIVANALLAPPTDQFTGADISQAITLCGTTSCIVQLQAVTYTDICVQIANKDAGLRILGKGQGTTTLKPYADLDDCTATENNEPIEINGSDNVELAHFTFDGDKTNLRVPDCLDSFGNASCGGAIWVNSPSNAISKKVWIHDLEIKNIIGTAVNITHGDGVLVERVTLKEIGCHQTADNTGDTTCGCALGETCGGWTTATNIGNGTRCTGIPHIATNLSRWVTFRDNVVDNASYTGIEFIASTLAEDTGYGFVMEGNDVRRTPSGLVVTTNSNVRIVNNLSHDNRKTTGTGDNGSGLLVSAAQTGNLWIEGNQFYDNASTGMNVKGVDGFGAVIRGNKLSNNCTDHNAGANLMIWTSGTAFRDILVESNVVSGSSGCTYALESSSNGFSAVQGAVRILGGSYDAGSSGSVHLNNPNMVVHGLKVNGNLLFGSSATGVAIGNEVSGTITGGGSMVQIAGGYLFPPIVSSISGGDCDVAAEVGRTVVRSGSGLGAGAAGLCVCALEQTTEYGWRCFVDDTPN